MKQRWRSLFTSLSILALVLVPTVYVVQHQQQILDWWSLRNYQVPAYASTLASETTMNNSARRVFYVNRPQLLDKATFYTSCSENEQTVVLGCYIKGKGIFVLNVTDKRLDGVEEVTAAHEMLHAAYDRLNGADKERIDRLVNDAYSSLHDEQITQKIELYKKNNADITNELHSILGTEVTDLPPELEAYYRNYFDNRTKIVGFAKAYQSVFSTRKQQLEEYDQKLTSLEKQIQENNATLDIQSSELQNEETRLTALRSSDVETYNASVSGFNSKVRAYNNLVAQNKQLVGSYRSNLDARNKVAEEAQELSKALDSRISSREEK